ncbi:MAG: phosphoribosylformylglycinamidine synthase subunit PurQ [Candidatus Syntrophonatronum acetioxidans]|uniref:Phosphoribosylformylglycinamidine synthase subunit PurQ n=1 Tax=Candidatus Syntrophonatronum acetioxidans TaxID=1795816 RepID=A0A424YD17_9FIRM|nr:MAG: phosphoribosylformylglycinamidine synthase subunit PurQ [Candidatus Syntrophonatronum acetioxidans]
MKFGVVVFPGSNCDLDAYYTIKDVMKQQVEYLWHKEKDLKGVDCVVLPGGFTYGDYLRPGAIASLSPVVESIIEFAHQGGLVLGICNGFQVLTEANLLPGALYLNLSLQFRCVFTHLLVENSNTPFTNLAGNKKILKIPVAHGDGNYYADPETLKTLEKENRIVFRYCTPGGEITREANPNGSLANIAGICNEKGNVLGMMPHPERAGEEILGSSDGKIVFDSILEFWGERR